MKMGRRRRENLTSGPRCALNTTYQFRPGMRDTTSQTKSWLRAWGCISSLSYCLAGHMVTAQTVMKWVNGYGNHTYTSIQVICGKVWIEFRLWGVSLVIPWCSHIYDKSRLGEKKNKQRSRRRNGSIWGCLLCGSPYPPTAWSKAVCAA